MVDSFEPPCPKFMGRIVFKGRKQIFFITFPPSLSQAIMSSSSSSSSDPEPSQTNGHHQDDQAHEEQTEIEAVDMYMFQQLADPGRSKYDIANDYFCRNIQYRREMGFERIYHFSEVTNLDHMYGLTSALEMKPDEKDPKKTVSKDMLKLTKHFKKDDFTSFMTCLGAIEFPLLDFVGNRDDKTFPPKTVKDIKQSVRFSGRQYDPSSEDKEESGHDPATMHLVRWIQQQEKWFLDKCFVLKDSGALQRFYTDVRNTLKAKAGRGAKLTDEDIKAGVEDQKFLHTVKKDSSRSIYNINFSSKLLRLYNDKKDADYVPPTAWLQEMLDLHGLVLRNIPIFVLKTQQELEAPDPTKNLWKQIPRNRIKIESGSIGMVRFTLDPTTEAGSKLALMAHISGLYLFSKPTELTKLPPRIQLEPEMEQNIKRRFPEMAEPASRFLKGYDSFEPSNTLLLEDGGGKRLRLTDGMVSSSAGITAADIEEANAAARAFESDLNQAQ